MNIERETKQSSSIHQKIRRAEFIPIESTENKTFKYVPLRNIVSTLSKWIASLKRGVNTIIQKPRLWASNIDFPKLREDVSLWVVNALIEGFTANVATHFLFGLDLNFWMVLAHGILIQQGIDIYWRLRKDGPNTKIPQKDK